MELITWIPFPLIKLGGYFILVPFTLFLFCNFRAIIIKVAE